MRVLILIPTYNERENVRELVRRITETAPGADMLFLDDASPDGTGGELKSMKPTHPRLHLMQRPTKSGLGRAYLDGFRWSLARAYDLNLTMDADLSHDPADIPRFLESAQTTPLVCGSRYTKGGRVVNWPRSRLCLSRGAAQYTRLVTGVPFTDPTGGFNAYRREALQALELDAIQSDGYAFQIEMKHSLWMRGFRHEEIPITFTERREGRSKMTGSIVREAIPMVWKLAARHHFRRRPESRG